LIKKTILILLLTLPITAISKPLLKGGVTLNNKCYFFLVDNQNLKIVDKNLTSMKSFNNVFLFDFEHEKNIVIFAKNKLTVLNKNLEQEFSINLKLHPFFYFKGMCNNLNLIQNDIILVPDSTPYLLHFRSREKTILPDIFSLTDLKVKLFTFDDMKISNNWLSFVNNKTCYIVNYKTGKKISFRVNGDSCSTIKSNKFNIITDIDGKYSYTYNLNKEKVIKNTKIPREKNASMKISCSFDENHPSYTAKIKILNTSFFSALSAWKKGVGNGIISIINQSGITKFEKNFEFSLKNISSAEFHILKKHLSLIIKLPKKDLIILKQKSFKLISLNKKTNYCVCNNKIFVFKNNKISCFEN